MSMTQRLQIAIVVSAALPLGRDMIHVARRRDETYTITFDTHWMRPQESQAQPTPVYIVATLGRRLTLAIDPMLLIFAML